jgi:hypothetical protein
MGRMKTKPSDALDVRKIAAELKEYENSPARGGLRITMPVEQAVKILAKHKPEPNKVTHQAAPATRASKSLRKSAI